MVQFKSFSPPDYVPSRVATYPDDQAGNIPERQEPAITPTTAVGQHTPLTDKRYRISENNCSTEQDPGPAGAAREEERQQTPRDHKRDAESRISIRPRAADSASPPKLVLHEL